jgi:sulfate transport system permease protein
VKLSWILIAATWLFMFFLLFLPLILIFHYAFAGGVRTVIAALSDPDSLSAIRLTLLTAAIVVPINTIFGIIMAWSIAKFEFSGKTALITVLDIPFAISPVVVGMMLILLFGNRGLLGPWLQHNQIRIIFNTPGIILATLFVTFPFVARELIPLMQSQGVDDEYAALSLGASGPATFFRVTLPNIKWGLMYGILLTNARAMGEFGAVSVVSGHIRGRTNTIPLQVEILYNDYQLSAAFAVASLLVLAALVTLVVKYIAGIRQKALERS